MKFTLIIDPAREEETIVYAHRESRLTEQLRQTVQEKAVSLIGYQGKEAVPLDPEQVVCFSIEGGKTLARTKEWDYTLKQRLYQLEEMLPADFIKINQSCLANIRHIRKFDASLSGTLLVIFQNGHRDYVSRRQLKTVKERLGL